MELNAKVSATGWLCVEDDGEWIVVFKLTDEQLNEWRWLEFYKGMRPVNAKRSNMTHWTIGVEL